MRQNIVLIDFENVQPENLGALAHDRFRVLVFVGANQRKIPVKAAASLQRLGSRAEYVEISGTGSNALDFHIAYYVGRLAADDPAAYFHIVSKDTGFDPLIAHLKSKKIFAGRVKAIADIPLVESAAIKSPKDRIATVMQKLSSPKATKPRTVKTLSSHIANMHQKQISDDEVREIVDGLATAGFISIEGTKITYAPVSG